MVGVHRMRRVRAGLAAAIWVFCGIATAEEQRCKELEANCVCSEPLNTNTWRAVSSNGWSPADSTVKECGAAPLWVRSDWSPEPATGLGLPSRIQWVARRGPESGDDTTQLSGRSDTVTSATRRVCVRFYTRYTSDYQAKSAPLCEANKFSELSFGGSNTALHWDWAESRAERLTIINFDGNRDGAPDPSYNLAKTGPLTIEGCRSQWCYAEMCASGRIAAGTDIQAEGHVRGVSDGRRVDWPKARIGTACVKGTCKGGKLAAVLIVNAYRQKTCGGSRYVSHAMQAQWDSDQGQLIGPAYEIEGDGGGRAADVLGAPGAPILQVP